MANPGYVRSTDGNNADTGATWALANADLTGAMVDAAAGDRLWVSQVHAETTAAPVTITLPGTVTSPNQILCGNDAAGPPTALATTATVTVTGGNDLAIDGSGYFYGIAFSAASGNVNNGLLTFVGTGIGYQHYKNCDFINGSTGSGVTLAFIFNWIGGEASRTVLESCRFKAGGIGSNVKFCGHFILDGGSVITGGTSPTEFFGTKDTRTAFGQISAFDFSNCSAGLNLFVGGAIVGAGRIVFRNCKLPASWSGSLVSSAITTAGFRAELYNCASGDTNYALWIEDCFGSIRHETTLVRTGGASDGTTTLSWKMVSSTRALYPHHVLATSEGAIWNDTSGASITATVEILRDSATNLKDNEIWLEVQYLGTSGFPLGTFITDAAADVLATAADQTASSETWTTTGMSNPNKQKLSVTFTPQEKGVILWRVLVAKASTTVFVDPKITLT